jgi:hypothetical protein
VSGQRQDGDLRERFEAMRREDAGRAPRFASVLARARDEAGLEQGREKSSVRRGHPLSWRRAAWASGLAAAAVIAALIVIPRVGSEEDAFEQAVQAFQTDPALGAWRSPTASLMNVPGSSLITTMPRVGAVEP